MNPINSVRSPQQYYELLRSNPEGFRKSGRFQLRKLGEQLGLPDKNNVEWMAWITDFNRRLTVEEAGPEAENNNPTWKQLEWLVKQLENEFGAAPAPEAPAKKGKKQPQPEAAPSGKGAAVAAATEPALAPVIPIGEKRGPGRPRKNPVPVTEPTPEPTPQEAPPVETKSAKQPARETPLPAGGTVGDDLAIRASYDNITRMVASLGKDVTALDAKLDGVFWTAIQKLNDKVDRVLANQEKLAQAIVFTYENVISGGSDMLPAIGDADAKQLLGKA